MQLSNGNRRVKPYRRYPGPDSRDRIWWLVIIVALLLGLTLVVRLTTGDAAHRPVTVEGKDVVWWAQRAKQARRDANARAVTVRRLRTTLAHSPSITEAIRLATIVYPRFSEQRAWTIIRHESGGNLHAYNPVSVNGCHARYLYQFLDCTFRTTPFARADLDPASPYVQSLAAAWMHQVGRGCEWSIGPEC
jgi:hypothetical protein